jgi:hypothetical protein
MRSSRVQVFCFPFIILALFLYNITVTEVIFDCYWWKCMAKVSITWHITGLIFLSFTKDWKLMMNPIRRLTRKGKF